METNESNVVNLESARKRLRGRKSIRKAYERWLRTVSDQAPDLIPRLLRLAADRAETRPPDEPSIRHPWVPLVLGRYGSSPLFEELDLTPSPELDPLVEGEFEVWRVLDHTAFDFTVQRIRRLGDRPFTRSKATLTPWFDPRRGDVFVAVTHGPWERPEWCLAFRVDPEVGRSLEIVIEHGDYGDGRPYQADLMTLLSDDRTTFHGISGQRFRSEDFYAHSFHWQPESDAEAAHRIISDIATLHDRLSPAEREEKKETAQRVLALLVVDEIVERNKTGVDLARDWILKAWADFSYPGAPTSPAPLAEVYAAFGLGPYGGLPEGVEVAQDTSERLLQRFCRVFVRAQIFIRETVQKRYRVDREFELLKFGMSLAPERFDKALIDLPLRDPIRRRIDDALGDRRLCEPWLKAQELRDIRGIGERSMIEILDAVFEEIRRA